MAITPIQDSSFSVKKNETIFYEGQALNSLNILVQGKVDVLISPFEDASTIEERLIMEKSCRLFSVDPSIFLGTFDYFNSDKYTYTYRAAADSVVYTYMAGSNTELREMFSAKKDYAAYSLNAALVFVKQSYDALQRLEVLMKNVEILTDNLGIFFWALKEKTGFRYMPAHHVMRESHEKYKVLKDADCKIPEGFDPVFFETNWIEDAGLPSLELDSAKLNYANHLLGMSSELRRSFFSEDILVTEYTCREIANLLVDIQSKIKDALVNVGNLFSHLCCEKEDCLFYEYTTACIELGPESPVSAIILQLLDYMIAQINKHILLFKRDFAYKPEVETNHIGELYRKAHTAIKSPGKKAKAEEGVNPATMLIPEELKGSARKILDYSGLVQEKTEDYLNKLSIYKKLPDRSSDDGEVRKLRNEISAGFFEIYEAVLKKAISEDNSDKLINLFLEYAFMDEELLSRDNIKALYELGSKPKPEGKYGVYSIRTWLTKIYQMEKDPSVNEFTQDYYDVFREMRRRGEASDEDKPAYDNNKDGRLSFEITNMFRINQRLCHSQLDTYIPLLNDDVITRPLSKAQVTPKLIEEGFDRLLEVDFSAFHREVSYFNMEKGIEKEFVMKSVPPEIILMPAFGSNAIMWQELTGRSRTTPGRFIIPAFTDEDMDEMLMRLVGNFRWELCKTMMGAAWADVSIKSLTSEYSDYIQFYKKNKDLSEESKERLKKQLIRYRNMAREVFIADYCTWISYESKGAVRLNKPVRDIFYKHVPFVKPIRISLMKNPMFTTVANQFENLRTKQAKLLEGRYNQYLKSGPLDQDLKDNLIFYKEK